MWSNICSQITITNHNHDPLLLTCGCGDCSSVRFLQLAKTSSGGWLQSHMATSLAHTSTMPQRLPERLRRGATPAKDSFAQSAGQCEQGGVAALVLAVCAGWRPLLLLLWVRGVSSTSSTSRTSDLAAATAIRQHRRQAQQAPGSVCTKFSARES